MSPTNPSQSTLLIILGASEFPHSNYTGSEAFKRAADATIGYFLASDGFNLNENNFCWLFDSDLEPVGMLNHISMFIQERKVELEKAGIIPTDIIFYYIGHGAFDKSDNYCLILKNTTPAFLASSSIPITSLSELISNNAKWMRSIVILDACFSAAAVARFQSNAMDAVKKNLETIPLPKKGISLLASSSKDRVSMLTEDGDSTMFSKALIATLKTGSNKYFKERLSLKEVHSLLRQKMNELYDTSTILPEMHSPKQPEGEVAEVSLFPNAAEIRLQEVTKEEDKKKSEQEAERLLAEEAKRLQRQEAEKQKKRKEAQEQQAAKELQIRKEAEERNLKRVIEEKSPIDSYRLEAENTEDREPDQTLLDKWIQLRLKQVLVEKLAIREELQKINWRLGDLPTFIRNLTENTRIEKRRGVNVSGFKDTLKGYKKELKEKRLKKHDLEKAVFLLEGQEEVLNSLMTGKLRDQVLRELKQKRLSGETISFLSVVDGYFNAEKHQRNNSFPPPPDLDAKWLFLLKLTFFVIVHLAFLA